MFFKMSRRLFLFRIQILNIFSEKKLEYKVTICCNKNDDHKKVVSPFNLIELWFFLPLKLSTKLRFILLEKLISILRKNYFEMQIGVQSKVCFSPLCHSLLTNILRFNVSLKEIVKMLHLCQKKIQRFLQIIECVKNLKIRDFLQNVECVFANMFGLSLTFF